MSKPLTLSLIIPVYNEERHLRACLDAVALQTVLPDEVIVVDNNSTDKTAVIAKRYPFVKVIAEKQQGVVFARDRGFDTANGDIIGRIDADTILPADWVAFVMNFYDQPTHRKTTWSSGCYYYNVRFPRLYGWAHSLLVFRLNRVLLGYNVAWGSNMAIPRPLWEAARGTICHRTDIHEDVDLSIHLHDLGYRSHYEPHMPVGAKMRRVRSERQLLWEYLQCWPRTLRVHHLKMWIVSWSVGVWFVYVMSPVPRFMERTAQLLGKQPLPE